MTNEGPLQKHYRTLLEAIAFDMDREAKRLPMLTQAEENALHTGFAGPDGPIPELAVHELFDLQAAATPDAVAIRFKNVTLTYRELISRADRVAWRLLAAGVTRETPVAIYLDRSAELPVAMLAVHEAGGAYVPLDPISGSREHDRHLPQQSRDEIRCVRRPAFDEFLTRANETVQEALIHQRMPFHKLVEVLNPPRDSQRTPLISINFTILRDIMDHKTYGSFDLRGQPSLSAGSLYDLFFFMVHWPNGWRLAVEFDLDLFEKRTAERMLEFLVVAFEFAISSPDARLSALAPPSRERIAPPESGDGFTAIEAPCLPPNAPQAVGQADAETRMMAIWRDVLQVREIGPTSNFFELGGHSLMAMRLVTRVASTFGVKINVFTLFSGADRPRVHGACVWN